MEKFKTILEKNTTTEIIEKKSRFIANLFYVETPQEAFLSVLKLDDE